MDQQPERGSGVNTVKLIAVITTVATIEDARRLARGMVERRLAACAQLSPIESFYPWNGSLQNEPEIRILFKTSAQAYRALEAAIVELHPYELPAIYAIELSGVHAPYAQWIAENTLI